MSNDLTFQILIQILQNLENTGKKCMQNLMEIDLELTEKSAKNTQRWSKLTSTIFSVPYEAGLGSITLNNYNYNYSPSLFFNYNSNYNYFHLEVFKNSDNYNLLETFNYKYN